jgi:hypothetical protein
MDSSLVVEIAGSMAVMGLRLHLQSAEALAIPSLKNPADK